VTNVSEDCNNGTGIKVVFEITLSVINFSAILMFHPGWPRIKAIKYISVKMNSFESPYRSAL